MTLHWRKRLEYRLLKWQARFESAAFDRFFPWCCVVVLWTIFALLALARSRELSQDAGLAAIMQSVWLIGEGFTPDASLLGQNYLSLQGGYLIYPIAGLTKLFPTAITLIIIQAGALALAAGALVLALVFLTFIFIVALALAGALDLAVALEGALALQGVLVIALTLASDFTIFFLDLLKSYSAGHVVPFVKHFAHFWVKPPAPFRKTTWYKLLSFPFSIAPT